MSPPPIKLGTWTRRRKLASGKTQRLKFHTLNWTCPETGRKRRLSLKTKAEAEAERARLLAQMQGKRYFNPNSNPTIADTVAHWLAKSPSLDTSNVVATSPLSVS